MLVKTFVVVVILIVIVFTNYSIIFHVYQNNILHSFAHSKRIECSKKHKPWRHDLYVKLSFLLITTLETYIPFWLK